MTHCAQCGCSLPTSLDEYGAASAPVCRDCWFGGEAVHYPAACDPVKFYEMVDELLANTEAHP
jgi:hypothetical protein